MSKKDFSVALKYVEARPRSQRRKGTEARVSGISVVGSGASATDLSLLQANLISVTNNFTALKDLFDSMFEKDSENNIHAKLSLWSSGGITAGGVGSGGSGGGGISCNRLDSWPDYSADKSGWVLSALLGKDLDNRVSALANAGYVTQSALAPYALRSEIPSLEGYFLASNFNQANIKSTLGISDWALAEYPTYLIAQGNVMAGEWAEPHGLSVGGWLSNDSGFGYAYGTSLNVTYNMWHHRLAFRTDGLIDHWMGINTNKMSKVGQLAHISDIPTKLSQLTDDVVAGNYLSKNGGTINGSLTATSFIGNLTGNADSANRLKFVQITSAYGDLNTLLCGGGLLYNFSSPSYWVNAPADVLYGAAIQFQATKAKDSHSLSGQLLWDVINGSNVDCTRSLWWRAADTNGFANSKWHQIAFTTSNVASATKLQTPRSIWGQSFDGTGDITHGFRSLYPSSYNGGVAHSILNNKFDAYGLLTRIFGNGSVSLQAQREANDAECFNLLLNHLGGNVLIGTTTDSGEKLQVNGNGKFTGVLISQALSSAGISIGCDASGVASDNYAREINTFANKLYLQYRGGDLYLCGGGGTTYIGGALDGKTANFTSLTSPAITTNTLTIGGATITYDSVNEALCINGNMYALGGITAGAAGISAYTSLESRVARLEQQLNIS